MHLHFSSGIPGADDYNDRTPASLRCSELFVAYMSDIHCVIGEVEAGGWSVNDGSRLLAWNATPAEHDTSKISIHVQAD